MDILKFKKGLEENLPKELEKDTFYISTDTKKMRLNDAVWEDNGHLKELINKNENEIKEILTQNDVITNSIQEINLSVEENYNTINELIEIVNENEDVTASALNDLNEKINQIIENIGFSSNTVYGVVKHGESDKTYILTPNTLHIWGEVDFLTLTLATEQNVIINEFLFQFESGEEPTVLSLPSNILWANDEIVEIESGYIYQISILNGLATSMKFNKNRQ
jgi:hypothetical protein